MYESFFGFETRPFLPAPTLDRYYPSHTMEQTVQTAARAIARAEGPVAIFGGTGLGKTICCMRIADHFRRNFEIVSLASSPLVTRRALLQSLLFELRMPYRELNEGELRLSLMNRLQSGSDIGNEGVLLIVDEAQTLSTKLLDEIRLLTNVMRNGLPRVRLVLCGTMKLEDILSHPHMESLQQRLASRCYLTPLSLQETANYVIHKIELCGVDHRSMIARDALDAIFRGSDGIPRLIDQLADQSLLLAAQARQTPVSAAIVGKAWGMLQQLPNPWSAPESIRTEPKSTDVVVQTPPPATQTATPAEPIPVENEKTRTVSTNMSFGSRAIASQKTKVSTECMIEFGELDDAFGSDTPESLTSSISVPPSPLSHFSSSSESSPRSAIEATAPSKESDEYRLAPEPSVPASITSKKQPTNLFDAFGSDFDEEFNLPVQSSHGYKSYSGVAFGNLNHDVQSFGSEPKTHTYSLPEAEDFLPSRPLSAPVVSPNRLADAFAVSETTTEGAAPVSNITPSQVANLERQVEEEMRELVSDLNMNAMSFDPMQSIVPAPQMEPTRGAASRFAERDVVSFAEMSEEWNEGSFYTKERKPAPTFGDDRDMLVVEEDLENIRGAVYSASNAPHRPVLHPYAKLFSNLRSGS